MDFKRFESCGRGLNEAKAFPFLKQINVKPFSPFDPSYCFLPNKTSAYRPMFTLFLERSEKKRKRKDFVRTDTFNVLFRTNH